MVAPSQRCGSVWCIQKRVHLIFFEVCNGNMLCPFEADRTNLATPSEMLGIPLCNESCQSVDCRQALIPCRNRAISGLLDMIQKPSKMIR